MQLAMVAKKAKKERYKKAASILLNDLYNATTELRKKAPKVTEPYHTLYNQQYNEISELVTWLMFQFSARDPKICTTSREIQAIDRALSMYRHYLHMSRKRKETRLYLKGV